MTNAELLAKLGLFVRPGLLEPADCAAVRADVASAEQFPSTVRRGSEYVVDEEARRTTWADVPAETSSLVERRLVETGPEIASHFGVPLSGIQTIQFLVYRPGAFFRAHRDSTGAEEAPEQSRHRRIAAVVFLNDEGGGYEGGALTFYGLLGGDEELGLPLRGEEGLLVAFPADVLHEVQPVQSGERYTAVTWFE